MVEFMFRRTSLKHSVLYFSWMLVILAGILPTGYLVHRLSRACVADTQRLAMRDLALVYQLLIEHGPFGSVEELHEWSLKIGPATRGPDYLYCRGRTRRCGLRCCSGSDLGHGNFAGAKSSRLSKGVREFPSATARP